MWRVCKKIIICSSKIKITLLFVLNYLDKFEFILYLTTYFKCNHKSFLNTFREYINLIEIYGEVPNFDLVFRNARNCALIIWFDLNIYFNDALQSLNVINVLLWASIKHPHDSPSLYLFWQKKITTINLRSIYIRMENGIKKCFFFNIIWFVRIYQCTFEFIGVHLMNGYSDFNKRTHWWILAWALKENIYIYI